MNHTLYDIQYIIIYIIYINNKLSLHTLSIYINMCVCLCDLYTFYVYTMWVPTIIVGHTKFTLEHVSFFLILYFYCHKQHILHIITWYILYTYIIYMYIFFYILHSIRIYYSHLACHASKQIMTKIFVTVVFYIILNGVLLFSVYNILVCSREFWNLLFMNWRQHKF